MEKTWNIKKYNIYIRNIFYKNIYVNEKYLIAKALKVYKNVEIIEIDNKNEKFRKHNPKIVNSSH